ncbi:hypothetical protein IW262DRAFT_1469457 [Armillaria fumosa]|nr:hypothetical protein IW262DRAFT_1469457 [Armillaria fumosa]
MYPTKYMPTAQYRSATGYPRTNQSLRTAQSMSTIQSMRATQSVSTIQVACTIQPMSTTKSQKYIVITGLGKRCVVLKSKVSTYQSLINYIHATFPGTYYWVSCRWILRPIVIKTCDLPACKGYLVDIQPHVWSTIIADIDNIQVSIAKSNA